MDRRQFSKGALWSTVFALNGNISSAQNTGGFQDARAAPLPDVLRCKICIVGAGAAGLTLARSLAETTDGIMLIESGGHDMDGETQLLYSGQQLGLDYHDLLACRLRYFGGTTNHWGGYCRANDPIDYEGRPDLNLPAWPFGVETLMPYVADIGTVLGIRADHFDPDVVLREKGLDPGLLPDAESNIIQTKLFQLATTLRLGPKYREDIAANPRITPYTNLNVTHVQLNDAGTAVRHLDCATLDGKTTRIEADTFVLCCHAIENARLLLASNDVQTPGIGNASDHVGRYFMDHIYIRASRFIPTQTFPMLYDRQVLSKHHLNANLSFTDDYMRAEQMPQYYCRFNPHYVSDTTRDSMTHLRRDMMKPGDLDFLEDLRQITTELPDVFRSSSRRFRDYVLPSYFTLEHRLEQTPNPASRIVLSDRKDALGNRIADLDWQLHDLDIQAFQRGQDIVALEMERLGYGVMEREEITRAVVEDRVTGHYHHIGTTRMSETAAEGVVDGDCKVHGIDNLFIGGSSTFPTAGYSGPTMMIMAMALRMANHLRQSA
jgi:choline dehydrogenase-like flavoprotein|tara:strand:+ start:5512 stop:7155 length:1644 start_codon:yes stop_codon:yes gene_type:complete